MINPKPFFPGKKGRFGECSACAALLKKTKEKRERLEKKSEKKRAREREKRAVVFLRFSLSLSRTRALTALFTPFLGFF